MRLAWLANWHPALDFGSVSGWNYCDFIGEFRGFTGGWRYRGAHTRYQAANWHRLRPGNCVKWIQKTKSKYSEKNTHKTQTKNEKNVWKKKQIQCRYRTDTCEYLRNTMRQCLITEHKLILSVYVENKIKTNHKKLINNSHTKKKWTTAATTTKVFGR